MGELRRQQAAAELLGRQPRLGRPRRPARRAWPTWTATTTASSATSSATPTATASRTWTRAARRTRRGSPQPAGRRPELLRLRALHPVLHRRSRQKQTNDDEPLCQGINQVPFYCTDKLHRTRSRRRRSIRSTGCRPTPTATASATTRTTRTTTTSRTSRSTCRRSPRPFKDRKYRQLDACIPNSDSRFCLLGSADVDGDGIPNRDDTDDDGDGLPDTLEQTLGTDPLRADSDSDGVSDGYEYWSALDLNGAAHPFPGKAPYPNAARRHRREPGLRRRRPHPQAGVPGLELLGPAAAAELQRRQPVHGRHRPARRRQGRRRRRPDELRGDQRPDADRLVDREVRRPERPKETPYPDAAPPLRRAELHRPGLRRRRHPGRQRRPGPRRLPELVRGQPPRRLGHDRTRRPLPVPGDAGAHTNPLARVNPFNPCKPIYSDACHNPAPLGYYEPGEDWASNVTPATAPPMGTQPGTHA